MIWPKQEVINFIQNEVMTLVLKEVGFFFSKKLKYHPKFFFGDDAFVHVNKQADANA